MEVELANAFRTGACSARSGSPVQHVDIVRRGVGVWNRWRQINYNVRPDLSGVNLQGANLSPVDETVAYFRTADLHRANLSGADLRYANLSEADLEGADLHKADLRWANLGWVILQRFRGSSHHPRFR